MYATRGVERQLATGTENTGLENKGSNDRAEKCRSRKCRNGKRRIRLKNKGPHKILLSRKSIVIEINVADTSVCSTDPRLV